MLKKTTSQKAVKCFLKFGLHMVALSRLVQFLDVPNKGEHAFMAAQSQLV